MLKFELTGFKKQIEQIKKDYSTDTFKKVATRGLNKIGAQVKTAVNREIRSVYNISKERVDSGTKITKANWENMELVLRWTGRTPGLQNFGAKATTKSGVSYQTTKSGAVYGKKLKRPRNWQEVTVEVIKGRRKKVKGKYGHGGFIATNPVKGGVGIFERVGKDRLPLRRMPGPDVPGMVNKRGMDVIQKLIDEKGPQILSHELEYELSKK